MGMGDIGLYGPMFCSQLDIWDSPSKVTQNYTQYGSDIVEQVG
jgi:hypothetical protein